MPQADAFAAVEAAVRQNRSQPRVS